MRLAYFDCFSGISGDMILGALVDLGVSLDLLKQQLAGMDLYGYELKARRIKRAGLAGTKVDVTLTGQQHDHDNDYNHDHTHRSFAAIKEMINAGGLKQNVKDLSLAIFTRLARAEAKIHGTAVEQVCFHEVGAVDSIVDIVGAAVGLDMLKIDQVYCSEINVGSGFVMCQHGLLPVPAPATLELLQGVPIYARGPARELATPTGAAVITTLAKGFGAVPAMTVGGIGYGAGGHDHQLPNLLRVILGTPCQCHHNHPRCRCHDNHPELSSP